MAIVTILLAFALALVHVSANKLNFLNRTPRSIWLSTAGGISVAYVFLHLLPELAEGQKAFEELNSPVLELLDRHAYLLALTGLAVFYGLERAAKQSRKEQPGEYRREVASTEIFALHIASFSIYNALVGYLLTSSSESLTNLLFFFLAMALHFIVNDFGLQAHYNHLYLAVGRWLISAAVLVGAAIGITTTIPEIYIILPTAFLAGAIILNVLKEELPEERESRFGAFLLGIVCYAALSLVA